MADEVESTNVQRGQVIPIFVRAFRRANNDHGKLRRPALQMSDHIAVRAINQPEAAKTRSHIFGGEGSLRFLETVDPHRVDFIILKKTGHALANLQIVRGHQNSGP